MFIDTSAGLGARIPNAQMYTALPDMYAGIVLACLM